MSGRGASGAGNGKKDKGKSGSAGKPAWCCSKCFGGNSKPFRNKAGTGKCAKCGTGKGGCYLGPANSKAHFGAEDHGNAKVKKLIKELQEKNKELEKQLNGGDGSENEDVLMPGPVDASANAEGIEKIKQDLQDTKKALDGISEDTTNPMLAAQRSNLVHQRDQLQAKIDDAKTPQQTMRHAQNKIGDFDKKLEKVPEKLKELQAAKQEAVDNLTKYENDMASWKTSREYWQQKYNQASHECGSTTVVARKTYESGQQAAKTLFPDLDKLDKIKNDPEFADLCGSIESFCTKVNQCRDETKKQQEDKAAAEKAEKSAAKQVVAQAQPNDSLYDAFNSASNEEVASLLTRLAENQQVVLMVSALSSKHRSQDADAFMADASKRQAEVAAFVSKQIGPQNKRLCNKTPVTAGGSSAFASGSPAVKKGFLKD